MSAAAEADPVTRTGRSRCGNELREARERLGWDLGEVAAALRIRHAYLEAIEEGQLSALPGNAYALGFLRTYATALGLDADDLSRRFRLEASDVNRRPELAFPAPVPERGVPTGATILLGLVVAVVAYGAWYRMSEHEAATTPRTVPPVPAQLLPRHREAPISPQVASVMPSTPATVPPATGAAASRAELSGATGPGATGSGATGSGATGQGATGQGTAWSHASASESPAGRSAASPAATVPANDAVSGTTATDSSATPSSATGTTPSPAASPGGASPGAASPGGASPATAVPAPTGAVVLVASAPTWVQVRSPDGAVIYDHVLQKGDTWTVPASPPGLLLATGNAGGLAISRNGATGVPLGRTGAVIRRIPLDASDTTAPGGAQGTAAPVSPASPAALAPTTSPPAAAPADAAASGTRAATGRHHPPSSAPATGGDDSADQLNAGELGRTSATGH